MFMRENLVIEINDLGNKVKNCSFILCISINLFSSRFVFSWKILDIPSYKKKCDVKSKALGIYFPSIYNLVNNNKKNDTQNLVTK